MQSPLKSKPIPPPQFPIDYIAIRKAFISTIMLTCNLDQNHVITEEPESQEWPRPSKPYISMKITSPAARYGDDCAVNLPDAEGNPTTVWNSGGPRKMTVSFHCYGNSHEEAYNYMSLWQSSLDLANIQAILRETGISVWLIGTVEDLSSLLNTGYEGRSHMDVTFGLAFNLASDLGAIESVQVTGTLEVVPGTVENIDTTVG
jgi:hypothetical protein